MALSTSVLFAYAAPIAHQQIRPSAPTVINFPESTKTHPENAAVVRSKFESDLLEFNVDKIEGLVRSRSNKCHVLCTLSMP